MEEEILLKTIREALSNQIKAALATLSYTIDSCPVFLRLLPWEIFNPFQGAGVP